MRLRYLLLAITAAALLPVLAGCGSSGSTAPETLPKAAFLHKADLICEGAGNEQGVKAAVYLEKHQNAPEADLVVPAGIPPLEKEAQELRELGLPEGHEQEGEAWLGEVEKALRELKANPSLALSQEHNPYGKANELGEKLGLVDCARNP